MNDEQLRAGRELQGNINETKRLLMMAQTNVHACYRNQAGHMSTIHIPPDVRKVMQLIVVSSLEDTLSKLEKEYEAL